MKNKNYKTNSGRSLTLIALCFFAYLISINIVNADSVTTDIIRPASSVVNQIYASTSTKPYIVDDINTINAPEIIARNAVVYDVKNKKFIYAKNAEEAVPMASLVKIITSAVFLQSMVNYGRQKI